jgi:proline-specific peptidase
VRRICFANMQSGYVDSDGVKLYYEIIGEGEPLLLLNGGPGFPHDYLQELRALSPYARLIFYDQRGTGKSDKADVFTYTVERNVEDLENLRRTLNLERVQILGHSWGGMLAQAYILKYPEHVTKLILADTFSSSADIDATLSRMLTACPPEARTIIEKYERDGLYTYGDTYPTEYQLALAIAYEPVNMSPPLPEYLQNSFAKLAYDVYKTMWGSESEFRITGTLQGFDVYSRLVEIGVPTLVIVGASDMPTVEMAERTTRAIPDARLEVFEHSRHFPFLEEPEKFFRVVSDFLREE